MTEFDLSRFLNGHVLPPLPPYPRAQEPHIAGIGTVPDAMAMFAPERVESTQFGTPQLMPLRIKRTDEPDTAFWLLPVECLITVSGKNIIAKRQVAKASGRGSIKEHWAQDDYEIYIEGLFTSTDSYEYPQGDLTRLRQLVEARKPLDVLSPIFEVFGITRIVVEGYSFPFTKGEENQNWNISAMSDDNWNLLLNIDDKGKDVL